MSFNVWPPATEEDILKEEREASLRELEWLINELQENLTSLREGLEECVALLQPTQPASTLVLSTVRSEGLKGYITRVGTRIVKGEMQLRMFGLPYTKGFNYFKLLIASNEEDDRSLILDQLIDCRNFVREALDRLPNGTKDARILDDELTMLLANIKAAKDSLSGTSPSHLFPYHALDPKIFDPPLPATLALDINVNDAAIVVEVRTLEPMSLPSTSQITTDFTSFGFRDRIAVAFGAKRASNTEGDDNQIYRHKGIDVRVKERVRVESQDPSLMSVLAKLGALEHSLGSARRNLTIAMEAAQIH